MKRSRLRRVSKKNSRPFLDVDLRNHYRDQNPMCEVSGFLKRNNFTECDFKDRSIELNHIFSMGQRPDLWSNMIVLSRSVHAWFHANLIDGRILCLWRKLVKNELNLDEIRDASGKRLEGWLAINHPRNTLFAGCHAELVAFAEAGND